MGSLNVDRATTLCHARGYWRVATGHHCVKGGSDAVDEAFYSKATSSIASFGNCESVLMLKLILRPAARMHILQLAICLTVFLYNIFACLGGRHYKLLGGG
jgi:hypothetical protein